MVLAVQKLSLSYINIATDRDVIIPGAVTMAGNGPLRENRSAGSNEDGPLNSLSESARRKKSQKP
ncbi:MAG: hypothetical protein A3I66_12805 [Burkholderiales bacterium RIFCSPLOWO2_02_FULL_57_36]|nr:MAG: hypothetical protein A3I66_12805 [Burkholderiales bacterium RIFCSPLOWO2_02_FULL_57_36]